MGWVILAYFVGFIVSIFVFRLRAGIGLTETPGLSLNTFGWSAKNAMKGFVWPIVLVVWLATGRPDHPVRFGENEQ